MIPCKEGCPNYCEGCHKTCAQWRSLQKEMQAAREKQKSYLRYTEETSRILQRQCRKIGGSRPAFCW